MMRETFNRFQQPALSFRLVAERWQPMALSTL